MYNGIGLTTPRGSGTSGYVIRNLSTLRSHQQSNHQDSSWDAGPPKHREPDAGILEHEKKRAVEVKCFELQSKLEDDEVDESEIEKQVSALREKLLENLNAPLKNQRSFKPSDTHGIAAAKKDELQRMARALGTRSDYQEGDSFDKEKQEELKLKRIAEREEREKKKAEDKRNMAEQKKKWEQDKKQKEENRRKEFEKSGENGGRGRGMPPPAIPTGPRKGRMGPPPSRGRGGNPRGNSRSDSRNPARNRRESPPPRTRKRSPSGSLSRSRSPHGQHKRPARDRSASPRHKSPSRSRSPLRKDRKRASPSRSRSRSPRSRSRSDVRSRSRSSSRSDSRPRSPAPRYRRSDSPPPSSARKPRSPVPTPGYTHGRDARDGGRGRDIPPHIRRGSPPPRGPPPSRPPVLGRDQERSRSPRRGGPPPRGRTPEKKGSGGRGRSASTGSAMSVSTARSRSRSRD
ncbi:hypothetical protein FA15DRAFT_754553 [Coprinopsis marcescibilis]|uniref:CWF21 domain-containing protein n=1 Tax=Coprinopsis marcescibilis TaxID=230819 RepID=A0A5C3L3B6_COPMA|nr:hypothetical protein FA15DRAFT_754553 [Coprinopsis marcescibilis]